MVAGLNLLICAPTAWGTEPPGYDGPPDATGRTLTADFAAYLSAADLVCACEFLDDGVTRKVGHGTPVVQTAAVSEVFFGDPSLRTIEVDKEYFRAGKGDKVLLARLGPAQIATIPDTPAARQGLRKAIHVAQRIHLENRFIDPDKLLAAAEELLRDYLAKLADRYPDHPLVGRNGVKAAKAVRCPAPLGSHILIIGGLKPLETDRGRADIPRGDGLILWVVVGTNPHRVFAIGRPDKDIAHIEEVTRDHVENRHTVVRKQVTDLPTGDGPLSMHLVTVTPRPDGRGRFGEELHTIFVAMAGRLKELNADPPRNIDAAINCLAAAAPAEDGMRDMCAGRPAYWAYVALQSPYVKGALSAQQKLRLVPMLIERLTDASEVRNETPYDGPVTLAHHMAYPLLCAITGEKFPPAIDRPRESLDFPAGSPLDRTQLEAARKRQQAWRDWWEKDGRPLAAPAAGVRATAEDMLEGVTHVDMHAPTYRTQRPLLCGPGRHFPDGMEMVFRNPDTATEFHVVFPKDVSAPQGNALTSALTLHGRFGTIQSAPGGKPPSEPDRLGKPVPDDYRYFVVSRWEIRNSPTAQPTDTQPDPRPKAWSAAAPGRADKPAAFTREDESTKTSNGDSPLRRVKLAVGMKRVEAEQLIAEATGVRSKYDLHAMDVSPEARYEDGQGVLVVRYRPGTPAPLVTMSNGGSEHLPPIDGEVLSWAYRPAASEEYKEGKLVRRAEKQGADAARPSPNAGMPWSKPLNGLQCRLYFAEQDPVRRQAVDALTFAVRNITQDPITLSTWNAGTPMLTFRVSGYGSGELDSAHTAEPDEATPYVLQPRATLTCSIAKHYTLLYGRAINPYRPGKDCLPEDTRWILFDPAGKTYEIQATLIGWPAVRDGNGQIVQCWNGRLDSNTIRLSLAARPKPARYWPTSPPPDAPASEWSAADEHGLQTRLIFMVRRAVQGSPMPLRVELRHKDGKEWAQNSIGGGYRGSLAVTDGSGKELTQCCHDLRFNTWIHAGQVLHLCLVDLDDEPYRLDKPGKYTVQFLGPQAGELKGKGLIDLPATPKLEFEIMPPDNSPNGDETNAVARVGNDG
jgi:hypothetical protein